MDVFRGETLSDFYGELVLHVLKSGDLVKPRGRECRELRPISLVTSDPMHCRLQGKINYRFGLAEFMAMIAGWDDVEWQARFNPNVAQFSDDGKTFAGAYGTRLIGQLERLHRQLVADPDTRQAVLQIWNYRHDLYPIVTKDRPCNTQVYFKLRHGKLHSMVMRRSADLVWGVPYDTFVFSNLLCLYAGLLGVGVGELTEVIDSAHIYTDNAGYYGEERVTQAVLTPRVPAPIPVSWDFDTVQAAREAFTDARYRIEGKEPLFNSPVDHILELLR